MSDTESMISHEDATDSSVTSYYLRIVLVGKTGSGKSSSGNTILNRNSFKHDISALSITKTCEKQGTYVPGKMISVIDTPGLFETSTTEDKLRSEIEKCVEMSVPGPHVFLLVIRLDVKFKAEDRNTVKWIQENFGNGAAHYTIILFTHADALKNKTLDEYISESSDLQALIDASGSRYHSFNNENTGNSAQVQQLLMKIEKMVHENEDKHYTSEMYQEAQKRVHRDQKLRIVLLGKTGSGKSATGNTILDRNSFKNDVSALSVTHTCQKLDVEIGDKNISVIDTPGLFDTSMTEVKLSSEIEKCVEMSVPGPHVFLLVIRLDVRFTEEEKNTVKWIQENFGEDAARYTIILFTHADSMKAKTFDEYIKESQDLQKLIDTCGGRYHSFDNENTKNRDQVKQLLTKIEKMLLENGGDHYTSEMYQKAKEKIKKREKFWSEKPRIVLLGKTGAGKSATVNTIFKIDNAQNSITQTCEQQEGCFDRKTLSLIDTPGLMDTSMDQDELEYEIEKCVEMSVPGPHVFLLVIRLDVRFTEEEKNTVKWIQENFGEDAARYTIILFTHADSMKAKTLDEYIKESQDLQVLIKSCSCRYHSFNNKEKKNPAQVTELLEKIEKMVLENEGDHYTNEMYQKAQEKIPDRETFWSQKPRIVLLGKSGSGKTASRKTILRDESDSQTSVTKTCEKHEVDVDGKKFRIIDTPEQFAALEKNKVMIRMDFNMLKMKDELEKCIYMSAPGPDVFLLVISVNDTVTEQKVTAEWIQNNLGENAVKYTIVLFTHADQLKDKSIDKYIKEKSLKSLVQSCGGRFHLFNNKNRKNHKQVSVLLRKIDKMAESNEWKHCTNEKVEKMIQRRKLIENVKKGVQAVAVASGPVGTGAIIAGGIVLGVTELILAPVALIAGGAICALGAGGYFAVMKISEYKKTRES